MYNFELIIPSALILIVIAHHYLRNPRLPVRQNRLFFYIMASELSVIVADILATLADSVWHVPVWLSFVLNMLYFIAFLCRIYFFFLYTANLLGLLTRIRNRVYLWFSLVFLVCELITLSSFFTGAVFSVDAQGYHRGPLYNILYACSFWYLLLALALIFAYRRNRSRKHIITILAFNLCLLIGNVVRIFLPRYLVMDVFCTLAIVMIVLVFENSTIYTTAYGGFNGRSLIQYMEEQVQRKDFRLLGFAVSDFLDEQAIYGVKQMRQGIELICRFATETFPEQVFFDLGLGNFALAGPSSMDYKAMVKTISARFLKPWQANDAELHLNVRFAHVSSDSSLLTAEQVADNLLLALMDEEARYAGNNLFIDIDQSQDIERDIMVKRMLDNYVESNSVEVYFQPIVDANSGKPVAAEALARIYDNQGEQIPASEFIPIAERNGMISRLGDQVMERVCVFLSEYADRLPQIQWVNVNLSPIQCMDRGLCERFLSILGKYRIPTRLIRLEITEESLIDHKVLTEQMDKLSKNGFQFSLDDFGSGFANLTRVKQFPFSNVKLDMKIVWLHCEDPDQVLPSFVMALKEKDYSITAEGIETERMAEMMRNIGCDYFQGYHYARPLPAEAFVQLYGE